MEPHTHWQNKAELEKGEEKAYYLCIMHRAQAPESLWNHGFQHTDEIRKNLAHKNLQHTIGSLDRGHPIYF
jgi:hypothetical protein